MASGSKLLKLSFVKPASTRWTLSEQGSKWRKAGEEGQPNITLARWNVTSEERGGGVAGQLGWERQNYIHKDEMAALWSFLNYNPRSIRLARPVRDVGDFSSATVERLQVLHS